MIPVFSEAGSAMRAFRSASSRSAGSMKKLLTGGNLAASAYSASCERAKWRSARNTAIRSPLPCWTARNPSRAASASSLAVISGARKCANCSGQSASRGRTACKAWSGMPAASITESKSGGFRWRAMKPSASSDCSKAGSTATMSSTTASLIARCPSASMQPRPLEQSRTLGGGQHHIEGDALVVDGERHVDARGSVRPEFSVEGGLTCDIFALHGQDDVAGLEFCARRGPLPGDADHHDLIVDLGRVHTEPGPRRLVDAAELSQVVEHRLEQIDRHDHVDVLGLALALAFELQRADADQLAAVRDQPGAAPVRVRGIGKDRFVQQILPVTGELLLRGDVAGDRPRAFACAAYHHAVADFGGSRRTQRQRIEVDAAKGLHQAEAADGIEAEGIALHHAGIAEMKPDRLGFGGQGVE